MESMLDEVCGYLNNWFHVKPDGIHRGTYEIKNGELITDFLQDGQYFRIVNSVFNDGVHKYPASGLTDETFTGDVWAMAVPPAVIALVNEISEWQEKYGGATSVSMSPYSSETFNNYTYVKSSGGNRNSNGNGGNSPMTWQDVYASRLVRWKKL